MKTRRSTLSVLLLCCCSMPAVGQDGEDQVALDPFAGLHERRLETKRLALSIPKGPSRLVVKFRDDARVRRDGAAWLSETDAPLDALRGVALTGRGRVTWRPLIRLPDDAHDRLEARGAERTGVRPIDLRGMYGIEGPSDELTAIAHDLHALSVVEWVAFERVMFEPPCVDVAPSSAALDGLQRYAEGVGGVNFVAARQFPSTRGDGIVIADIEFGFLPDHEDLCAVITEPGQTVPSWVSDTGGADHGTAVLGIMSALDNGYGMTGLVPDAQPMFFPEWSLEEGSRRASAIANAAGTLAVGDIIVLEMQAIRYGDDFGPAELDPSVWSAVRSATDAGLIVIGAAGNGAQDLDGPVYEPYRERGDSGAIIVGAGTRGAVPTRLVFSTYGSRVDLHAWGAEVATLGYGALAAYGGDPNQAYTDDFGGTSAATPIVASVAAMLQGYAKSEYGVTLSSAEMRHLLRLTGTSSAPGGPLIGPRPDAHRAIVRLDTLLSGCIADFDSDGIVDISDFAVFGNEFQHPGCADDPCEADLDIDGDVDISDFAIFGLQFGSESADCQE